MVLTNSKVANQCSDTLSGIAEPHRIQIIDVLRTGPKNVTEIAKALKTEIVNVSHHLTVLKHAHLIQGKKQGRFVWYSLASGILEEVVGAGIPCEALNLGCCRLELPLD